MQIIKRNGKIEEYSGDKIVSAMRKAFSSVGQACDDNKLQKLLKHVQEHMDEDRPAAVETIQDLVEQSLMAYGYYDAAKSYILYRENRTRLREACRSIAEKTAVPELYDCLREIGNDYPGDQYDPGRLKKERPALFTKERTAYLRDMVLEGVRQEIAWGEYIIGDQIPGLNRSMAADYIKYLGNLRCLGLGFEPLFEGYGREPKEMAWVNQYANANMVKTDFFEAKSTAYAKSTALEDDL